MRRLAIGGLIFSLGWGCGYLSLTVFRRSTGASATRPSPEPAHSQADGMTADQREKAEALMALGYAGGYEPATERVGILSYDRERAASGLNLVVSGHAPSATLMDMEGRVLHRWHKDFNVAWQDTRLVAPDIEHSKYWKRVHLFPNGDLIAMWEGTGLVKLDRNSRIIWRHADPVHHDFDIDPLGNILVLLKRAQIAPALDPDQPVLEDQIAFLSPDGERQRGLSVLGALLASPYASLLRFHRSQGGDVLHTNTLALIDERQAKAVPSLKRGNVLVALRSLDFVGVIDLEQKTFVWGLAGLWHQPHEPVLLDTGRLLIFDNYAYQADKRHWSRAMEIDPVSHRVTWSWAGPPRFFSKVVGLVQRLANGNTLMTVSTEGRALEVTPGGSVVWEYRNPQQMIESGEKKIATIFELVRMPASAAPWLDH